MFDVDVVVSLGAWCQVKYQIDKICRAVTGSPFDWLVTPLSALPLIFKDNGVNFANKIVYDENRNVICAEYGVAYHHEFERDADSNQIVNSSDMLQARSKLTYKLSKLKLDCKDKNVLFIRLGGHAAPAVAWPYIKDDSVLSATDLNKIAESIEKTFECRDFRFLLVLFNGLTEFNRDSDLDSRIIIEFMDIDHPVDGWEGSTESWIRLMLRLKINDKCNILAG